MANALKAINQRVKALAKKHPKSKRTTLQKQAGKEWKAGKLSGKKKPAKKRTVSGKRKYKVTHRVKRVAGAVGSTTPRKRAKSRARHPKRKPATRTVTRTVTKYRTVRGPIKPNPLLLIGGLALGGLLLYEVLKKPTSSATLPAIAMTGNPTRDNAAQNLIAYAQAANLGLTAIEGLIKFINSSSDSTVVSKNAQLTAGDNSVLNLDTWV